MIAFKLALRNLLGAGFRTWLNTIVLSMALVIALFYSGLMEGWSFQSIQDSTEWETGAGQYWVSGYDKYDPATIKDSHASLSQEVTTLISDNKLTPVLLHEAVSYPNGRMQTSVLYGIDPDQSLLKLPSSILKHTDGSHGVMMGAKTAKRLKVSTGDNFVIRWRDSNGTFDAIDFTVDSIFICDVATVDNGSFYIDINLLREMTGLENEATYLVAAADYNCPEISRWEFKDNDFLLKELLAIMSAGKMEGYVMYLLLLMIGLLTVFDTQVLAVFRRKKEIGTFVALGMTKARVKAIFTIEGTMYSVLSVFVGAIWGAPILWYLYKYGIDISQVMDGMEISISSVLHFRFTFGAVLGIVLILIFSAAIVSYMPARKISKMNPTDAIRGR